MQPRPQVRMSRVNTISPMPFPVLGEDIRTEMMLYFQIREARLPGKGAEEEAEGGKPVSALTERLCSPGCILEPTPSHLGRQRPLLPGLRKQERVVRRGSRQVCQAAVVRAQAGWALSGF